MYAIPDTKRFRFFFVGNAKDHDVSQAVLERRSELKLSLREVAARSEGAISHGHLGNLENGSTSWKGVKYSVLRGIERALEWKRGHLTELIHGKTTPASPDEGVIELVNSDYVTTVIVILSHDGTEIGEKTVTVKRENLGEKLYGFTNQHNTVHSIAPGQSVKINSQKTFQIGDMVLVRASGQVILAYTLDAKASRVITAQDLELKTDKVWGKAFERLENDGDFKRPQIN
jgi:transcriptional regulator with XRE-family HTH domain